MAGRFSLGFIAYLLANSAICIGAEPNNSAEVLQKFVGHWQTQTHIQQISPQSREVNTKGQASCQPTLGGRWFEFRTETIPPGESDLQVMTFDEQAQVYRQWIFSSDGYQHTASGTWDESTSILTWKGKTSGGSFVIEDHWVSPDRLDWTLRRIDSNGKLLQTIDGTVTRDKP
jgi:hypothetical protein